MREDLLARLAEFGLTAGTPLTHAHAMPEAATSGNPAILRAHDFKHRTRQAFWTNHLLAEFVSGERGFPLAPH